MHLKTLSNVPQQGDREPSTKVFAKFLKPLDHHQFALLIFLQEIITPKRKSQAIKQSQNTVAVRIFQETHVACVNAIQRDTDSHRLAPLVPQLILGRVTRLLP